MGNSEDESSMSVEHLIELFVNQAGGEVRARELLFAERKRLSGLSTQAGGDDDCLGTIALIDELVAVLDASITPGSLGNGTTGEGTRKASRWRR